ncbi:MAG: MFS transporter [Sedimentisphaerales bacterium]
MDDQRVFCSEQSRTTRYALTMTLAAALLGWMFDGFEMGLFPLVARPALMELMGPQASRTIGTWFSVIIAMFLVGAACGGIFFGWLGDRIGRVRALVWSVATYSVFSGLCGFATAPWHLAVLRFIASLGMGGEWALGVALVMEVWPSSSRPMLAGLIGVASNAGFLLIALMGLGLVKMIGSIDSFFTYVGMPAEWKNALLSNSAWRLLLFLGAMPAILTFFILLFVPESPRWKQASEQSPANRVSDIFKGGLAKSTIKGSILGAIILLGTWGSTQWLPAWADKLSGQIPTAKSWAQIWSAIGAIVGAFLAAYLAKWTTRRLAYFILCILAASSCAYLFRTPFAYGNAFLFWVFIVGGVTASFFGWLPLYLPELFPTRIRATAQGFAYNIGRVLAAAGTLGAGRLLNYFNEDYARMCAVVSLVYILGIVFIWFCPETKNKPLPE